MTFTPIVSLLEGVPGLRHLTRAIELYLECEFLSKKAKHLLLFQSTLFSVSYKQKKKNISYQISLLLKIYSTSWTSK